MKPVPPPVRRWTRRAMLGAAVAPAILASRSQETPGEAKRFLDAATEFEVLRVTALEHNSWLPLASNRSLSRKGDWLLLASDVSGTPQLYRHEFKANRLRQLTEAEKLNTNSFSLTQSDRGLIYVDGRKVIAAGTAKERTVWELPADWAESPRLAVSDDGLLLIVSAFNGTKTRITLTGRTAQTVVERDGDIGTLQVRPRRSAVSYIGGGGLCVTDLNTRKTRVLKTAPGEVLSSVWTADGEALLYLVKPAAAGRLNEIREYLPESDRDSLVAKTSQYTHFQRNGDSTVFLGASGSAASPHLLLLLRSVKRELTICEHRCSDARLSRAVLSPNSSRMAFQTDRHGNMVIYSMQIDRLIEETEDNA